MSKIDRMAISSPDLFTLTDEYNVFVESMTGWLRENSQTDVIIVPPETGYLYRFDLTSYLLDNNVPLEDHRLLMRVNGMNNPQDFDEKTTSLIVPSAELIARLKSAYRTKLSGR